MKLHNCPHAIKGLTKECKSFYGSRYDDMKRKKKRHRKRKSRQKIGIDHELKKQKETYNLKKETKQVERKKYDFQRLRLRWADRENVLHWKLAKKYLKTYAEND